MSERAERLQSLLTDYEAEFAALVETTHWIAETKRNPLTLHSQGVLKAALTIEPARKRIAYLRQEIQAVMREMMESVRRGDFDMVEILAAKAARQAVSQWNARLDAALGDYQDARAEEVMKIS